MPIIVFILKKIRLRWISGRRRDIMSTKLTHHPQQIPQLSAKKLGVWKSVEQLPAMHIARIEFSYFADPAIRKSVSLDTNEHCLSNVFIRKRCELWAAFSLQAGSGKLENSDAAVKQMQAVVPLFSTLTTPSIPPTYSTNVSQKQ